MAQSRILWIRALELVLGTVCFALYKKYGYLPCTFTSALDLASARCRIPDEIAVVAVVAFPLFIIPIFIIVHVKYGTKFDSNIISPLFALVGFILFIVAGSVEVMLTTSRNVIRNYTLAGVGTMLIVTSLTFLGELIYWLLFR